MFLRHNYKVNSGLLYLPESIILIVMLLTLELKLLTNPFILMLFRWFQNINFLVMDSQPPPLYALSSSVPVPILFIYKPFVKKNNRNLQP